ncbi:MAG: response regulator, partial [Calditrichaeota bacterium]
MPHTSVERPPRILIIDDEEAILNMLCEYFRSLDYVVLEAPTAERGIDLVRKENGLDLVITDIDLPGMSGIDFLQVARSIRQGLPVIIITGLKTLDYAISAIKHGAIDYITKPFELSEVRKIVEKVLRHRISAQLKERIFRFTQAMSINWEVPTRELNEAVMADYLARFLVNSGFCDQEEYHQYYMAFIETLINAIEHGNLELPSSIKGDDFQKLGEFDRLRQERMKDPHYGNRLVKISFLFNPERFSLTIADEGPGFDWRRYVGESNQFYQGSTEAYGRGFLL